MVDANLREIQQYSQQNFRTVRRGFRGERGVSSKAVLSWEREKAYGLS
jgi:hypothetical protein